MTFHVRKWVFMISLSEILHKYNNIPSIWQPEAIPVFPDLVMTGKITKGNACKHGQLIALIS